MGLNFVERLAARVIISSESDEKKEIFLKGADPDGNLSPDIRTASEAVFDACIDVITENLEDFNPDDPFKSAMEIVKKHVNEVALSIHEKTGIDLNKITPHISDDFSDEQMQQLVEAVAKGIEEVKKDPTPDPDSSINSLDEDSDEMSAAPPSEKPDVFGASIENPIKIITGPSSIALASMVPLGLGTAMVHGDTESNINAGGKPIAGYFGEASNEEHTQQRIAAAATMENTLANAPAYTEDPNMLAGYSAPAPPSA